MQWKTSRVSKAEYLAKIISPFDFAILIRKRHLEILKSILDDNGSRVFSDGEIEAILNRLTENNNFEDYETLTFEDHPSITVTKHIREEDGTQKIVSKNLSQLSLGQQQSILLAILLQSKSRVPFLIDQPEDNLDSEFICNEVLITFVRMQNLNH